MESTIKKEKDGLKVEVKINRSTTEKKAYADGWDVKLGKETKEFITISIEKNGKKAFCRDMNFFHPIDGKFYGDLKKKNPQIYARFSDTYISEPVYNIIKETLDEAMAHIDTATNTEYKAIKSDEAAKKEQAKTNAVEIADMDARMRQHPGWCDKCHSHCYGDCEANQ